jgi:hypothetical protein
MEIEVGTGLTVHVTTPGPGPHVTSLRTRAHGTTPGTGPMLSPQDWVLCHHSRGGIHSH